MRVELPHHLLFNLRFLCGCGRGFDSMSGLGSHRRHCPHARSSFAAGAASGAAGSMPDGVNDIIDGVD